MIKKIFVFVAIVCSFSAFSQFKIPEKPKEAKAVYDYASLLSKRDAEALNNKLVRYADTTSTQIVVAIVKTIEDEDIGILTPKWGHSWGVGQSKEDNGVFILLSEQERRIYISPGYGLEHILTAGINGQIIRKYILPEFKKGNYYLGLDAGTSKLMELFSGTYKNEIEQEENFPWAIFLFILLLIFLSTLFFSEDSRGKNKGQGGGGLDLSDIIILSSAGRRSGSFGSMGGFGGGTFGRGFGGGGFSGGGAGGSW